MFAMFNNKNTVNNVLKSLSFLYFSLSGFQLICNGRASSSFGVRRSHITFAVFSTSPQPALLSTAEYPFPEVIFFFKFTIAHPSIRID